MQEVAPLKQKFKNDLSELEDSIHAATTSAEVVFAEVIRYFDSNLQKCLANENDNNTIGGIK